MQGTAIAQPNIALIKYWGKRDVERNLPAVGSISVTLRELYTRMRVEFDASLDHDVLTVNGKPEEKLLPRLSGCLDSVAGTERARARIASTCNFPIAAGLASSASAFAALTVAAARRRGDRQQRTCWRTWRAGHPGRPRGRCLADSSSLRTGRTRLSCSLCARRRSGR